MNVSLYLNSSHKKHSTGDITQDTDTAYEISGMDDDFYEKRNIKNLHKIQTRQPRVTVPSSPLVQNLYLINK